MIALTVSDVLDADAAVLRISDLLKRNHDLTIPDAICIRNDSFSPEPFASMTELISKLWQGQIILETEDPSVLTKAVIPIMDRSPILIGANSSNLEQFTMVAHMFGCSLCVSAEDIETLFNLAEKAEELGVKKVLIDPMMRNMKQCLETCTDIKRVKEILPKLDYEVVVRSWSGEYAMTMATVSLLTDDALIIVDDLDYDCCDTLSALLNSIR